MSNKLHLIELWKFWHNLVILASGELMLTRLSTYPTCILMAPTSTSPTLPVVSLSWTMTCL